MKLQLARRVILSALSALMLAVTAPAIAAQRGNGPTTYTPLQQRMSYTDFTRAGLDRLSPAQLKALNDWLRTHAGRVATPSNAAASTPHEGAGHADSNVIHSHIVGTFRGWSADTVFTLANGQRWQVVGGSDMMFHSMKDPAVTLHKGFFGSWMLDVDGVDQSVRVSRAR